jgi:hypothetical protein
MLAHGTSIEGMKAFRLDMHRRMKEYGRDPGTLKILFLIDPILGDTDRVAQAREEDMKAARFSDDAIEKALWGLSYTSGGEFDFSTFDLDKEVPDVWGNGETSTLRTFIEGARGKTLREAIATVDTHAGLAFVGSPDTVAAKMGEAMEEVGGDGFLLSPIVTRRNIAEIADGLAPTRHTSPIHFRKWHASECRALRSRVDPSRRHSCSTRHIRAASAYTFGVALCLCCLAILAYTPVVTAALLTLGVAGIGQALFGSTQATLPGAAVAPHERAAALGLLATTIGVALPTGMVVLGVTSSVLGAQLAMLVSALVGRVALAVTLTVSGGAISVGGKGDSVATQPELGERSRLPGLVLDDVLEPDQGSADVDTDQLGGLLVGGDRADGGLAAADANPELLLENQDDVALVDVEVGRLILAEGDVADRQPQRQTVFQHEALDHQHGPADRQA